MSSIFSVRLARDGLVGEQVMDTHSCIVIHVVVDQIIVVDD